MVAPDKVKENQVSLSQVKILGFKEKDEWQLTSKYTIGKKPQSQLPNA
jgi:hypothetical protein